MILPPTDTKGYVTPSQGGDGSSDPCVLSIVSAPEGSPLFSEQTIDVNWGRGPSLPPRPLPSLPHPCPSPSPTERPQLPGGPQWTVAPRSPCCDWLSSLSAQRLQGRPQAIDQPPLGTAWTRHTRQTRMNADTFTCNRREAGESQGSRHPTFCRACFSVHCLAFLRKTGLLYLNSED